MRLDRDRFVITYDTAKATGEDVLALIKKAGFTAQIVENEGVPSIKIDPTLIDDPLFVEILKQAKRENKLIVLDFGATWCDPCKELDRNIIRDPRVAKLLKRCIFRKIDSDRHPQLSKDFAVVGLPDVRFLSPTGLEQKRLVKFSTATEFALELERFIQKMESTVRPAVKASKPVSSRGSQ